jgi:hypothetical protein
MATPRDADALQNGAYVALSQKFCGQLNMIEIFPWRAKRATPGRSRRRGLSRLFTGSGRAAAELPLRWRRETATPLGCKVGH